MKHSFISRWSPGVVALRWRHLFWALPLIGLLVGGGIEWANYQRSIEARSVIQRQESATLSLSEIRELILSDAVLEEAALNSGYLKEWKPSSADRLRKIVRCEEIKGTSLLSIHIEGRSTSTKVDLCNQLPLLAGKKTDELRSEQIKKAEAELQALHETLKEKRRDYIEHLKGSLGVPEESFKPTPEYIAAKNEFGETEKALDAARTDYINFRLQGVVKGLPIVILERAATPVAFSIKELLQPLSRTSYWGGAAILLAVLLAYFMEWRYPRRADSGPLHGLLQTDLEGSEPEDRTSGATS